MLLSMRKILVRTKQPLQVAPAEIHRLGQPYECRGFFEFIHQGCYDCSGLTPENKSKMTLRLLQTTLTTAS